MNIFKILPHIHKPKQRTWFDESVLVSLCGRCNRLIIRTYTGQWVRKDKAERYLKNNNARLVEEYSGGERESINRHISQ